SAGPGEGGMTETTTVTGGIPAQPGPREGAYQLPAGSEETRVDAGERTGEPSGAAAGPDGPDEQGRQGGHGEHGGSSGVIPGAGPVTRPGERATLRLRDGADANHGGHGEHGEWGGHDDRPVGHD